MSGFWHNYRSSMAGQEQSLSNSFCQGTNSTPVPWNRHSTRAMSEDEELSNLSYQKTQMVPLTSISVLINICSTRVVGQEEELNSVSPPEETNGPIGIDISTFRQTQHACVISQDELSLPYQETHIVPWTSRTLRSSRYSVVIQDEKLNSLSYQETQLSHWHLDQYLETDTIPA